MQTKQTFLQGVLLSSVLLLIFTLNIEGNFLSKAFSNKSQEAQAIESIKVENIYNISPSKESPGTFKFNYVYEKTKSKSKEALFDLPITPFDDELARKILEKEYGLKNVDFGPIRDVWNYPSKENAFMKQGVKETKKQSFLDSLKINKAVAYDEDTQNPGVYNCRANTSITGYFKAYFEDVALNTNIGFDDGAFGDTRREEACQVLEDISELLMLDATNITPDILFSRSDQSLPSGALAAATSYFGYSTVSLDNGSLHKYIISRQDPTPVQGYFDALIMTNFSGVSWSVDSNLNTSTYDFYTVMWHEVMHALGFRSSMPAVITETNISHRHGTFDYYTKEDEILENRFIEALANILNVPTGAPSPWFITNEVVYRGVKNILDATPDGIRPIYSPISWEQGSSLSHFDMNRAPGETYIMHPSIGTNTERDIHEHEKEVLCHLGYMVEGLEGCEVPTPVAVDDIILTNSINCSSFTTNDYSLDGGELSLNTFEILQSNPGDTFQYINGLNCSGSISSQLNALSFYFTPSVEEGERIIKYTLIDSVTGRVSFPAYITNSEDYCLDYSPENFICNGDFESGELEQPSSYYGQISQNCPSNIRPWCILYGTVDIFDRVLNFINPWVPQGPDTHNGAPNDRYLGGLCTSSLCENAFAKTKAPLLPGEYLLSFYGIFAGQKNISMDLYLTDTEPGILTSTYEPLENDVHIPVSIVPTSDSVDESDWQQYFTNFSVPDNITDYNYLIFIFSNGYRYYLDDVLLTLQSPSSINGHLYQDLNQNGSWNSQTEQRLPGIQVGLFQSGNPNPIQTTTTQGLPNIGKYIFSNLPEGVYYVALIGENTYTQVTEPGVSTDPFPTYDHMYQIVLNNGQTIEDRDFGITLINQVMPGNLNLKIEKQLIDSSLSFFDRYITWRIWVVNGSSIEATNIQISDVFPDGIIYHSQNSPNENNTYNPTTGILNIPSLSPYLYTNIDITTRVPSRSCGIKINTATLVSLDQTDTNIADNSQSASIRLNPCAERLPGTQSEI